MNTQFPLVLVATGYPLHGDALRSYLQDFRVQVIQHTAWNPGLPALQRALTQPLPVALLIDATFPYNPVNIAAAVQEQSARIGLIYLDDAPNIFRVLHSLENGFLGYLSLNDDLTASVRAAVEAVRRGERFLSPSILGLYERYRLYRGVFASLPRRLEITFKLMAEGLSAAEIQARLRISMSVVYRRQYRLRKYFGVETNDELLDIICTMFAEPPCNLTASKQN